MPNIDIDSWLSSLGVDGYFTNLLSDVRYLSNFTGSNGYVVVARNGSLFFTDGRYLAQAQEQCRGFACAIGGMAEAAESAVRLGVRRLAVDSSQFTAREFSRLTELCCDVELVDLQRPLRDLRMVKNDEEIAALREACEITVHSFQEILNEGLEGRTEVEIAGRLEHLFRVHGAEDRAFASIVATGANSANPHHGASLQRVVKGDFVKVDCGARVAGYHADFTRTVVVGTPTEWQQEIHRLVAAAQRAAVQAVKPGVSSIDLDALARGIIAEGGRREEFVHPLGHGVGLDIHEYPILGREEAILRPRMVVTIEPGIYTPGLGGVRIEDTVLVSESGATVLTEFERGLIEV